jgi:hypothetical protein
MNPTRTHKKQGIDWRAVVQLALGVAAGIVAALGTIAVAVTSFTLSFDAITAVAKAAHIRSSIAWMMPVTVDGAMLVATVAAIVMHHIGRGRRAVAYPWTVVIIGAGISIACNAAHATGQTSPDGVVALAINGPARMAISAIPAVMATLSVHLLITLIEAFGAMAGPAPSAGTAPTAGDRTAPVAHRTAPPQAGASVNPGQALTAPASAPPAVTLDKPHSGEAAPAPKPRTGGTRTSAARKRTSAARKPRTPKVKITDLNGAELVEQIRTDMADAVGSNKLSARQIRIRYGIGTGPAGEVFERYKTALGAGAPSAPSEGTASALSAGDGPASEAAGGGAQ